MPETVEVRAFSGRNSRDRAAQTEIAGAAGESGLTPAIPVDNPCCSCKLTRVRSRCSTGPGSSRATARPRRRAAATGGCGTGRRTAVTTTPDNSHMRLPDAFTDAFLPFLRSIAVSEVSSRFELRSSRICGSGRPGQPGWRGVHVRQDCRADGGAPQTWTVLPHDGPDHRGLLRSQLRPRRWWDTAFASWFR